MGFLVYFIEVPTVFVGFCLGLIITSLASGEVLVTLSLEFSRGMDFADLAWYLRVQILVIV